MQQEDRDLQQVVQHLTYFFDDRRLKVPALIMISVQLLWDPKPTDKFINKDSCDCDCFHVGHGMCLFPFSEVVSND